MRCFCFIHEKGIERRLLATRRGRVATAVAFPQKSDPLRVPASAEPASEAAQTAALNITPPARRNRRGFSAEKRSPSSPRKCRACLRSCANRRPQHHAADPSQPPRLSRRKVPRPQPKARRFRGALPYSHPRVCGRGGVGNFRSGCRGPPTGAGWISNRKIPGRSCQRGCSSNRRRGCCTGHRSGGLPPPRWSAGRQARRPRSAPRSSPRCRGRW